MSKPLNPRQRAERAAKAFANACIHSWDEADSERYDISAAWTNGVLVVAARKGSATQLDHLLQEHELAVPDMRRST